MERITGRVAITVMAEVDMGFRKLTDEENNYVYRQAAGFRDWLVNKHGKTVEEAKEICRNLYDKDCALLAEVDPYADFIWSRGQEVGQAEIDISLIADMDEAERADAEHRAHQAYWEGMERTADRFANHKSAEQWKMSEAKFNYIVAYLEPLKKRYQGRKLTTKDHVFLAKVNRRVNELRFGKAAVLTFKHWAVCHNMLVEITGSGKVINVQVPVQRDPGPDSEDALAHASESLDQVLSDEAGSTEEDGDVDRET